MMFEQSLLSYHLASTATLVLASLASTPEDPSTTAAFRLKVMFWSSSLILLFHFDPLFRSKLVESHAVMGVDVVP